MGALKKEKMLHYGGVEIYAQKCSNFLVKHQLSDNKFDIFQKSVAIRVLG